MTSATNTTTPEIIPEADAAYIQLEQSTIDMMNMAGVAAYIAENELSTVQTVRTAKAYVMAQELGDLLLWSVYEAEVRAKQVRKDFNAYHVAVARQARQAAREA